MCYDDAMLCDAFVDTHAHAYTHMLTCTCLHLWQLKLHTLWRRITNDFQHTSAPTLTVVLQPARIATATGREAVMGEGIRREEEG